MGRVLLWPSPTLPPSPTVHCFSPRAGACLWHPGSYHRRKRGSGCPPESPALRTDGESLCGQYIISEQFECSLPFPFKYLHQKI